MISRFARNDKKLILTPDQLEDKKRGFSQDSGFQLPRE